MLEHMMQTPLDAVAEEQATSETLEQARERFNRFYQAVAGREQLTADAPGDDQVQALASVGQTLAPMFVPGAVFLERLAHIGINSTLLQPAPQGLVLMMQHYPGMKEGDCLEVFWHADGLEGEPVFTHLLQSAGVGRDVPIYLPVQKVVEGIAQLYCRVTREGLEVGRTRALGVLCKPSLPGGPDPTPDTPWHGGLSAPTLVRALETANLPEFIEVTVEPWLFMHAGGLLQLMWGTSLFEYRFKDEEVGLPLTLMVPAALVREAGSGVAVPVRYRIIDVVGDASAKWSAVCSVNVQLETGLCDAPRLHGATEAQTLDLRTSSSQPWRVLVWASGQSMLAGDVIELQVLGTGLRGQQLTLPAMTQAVDETGKGYLFSLPADWLAQLASGWLKLGYRVLRGGQERALSGNRYLEVDGAEPTLPFAQLPGVKQGVLDPDLPGCSVMVGYAGLARGDRVKLYWHGATASQQPYVWEVTRTVSRVDAERRQVGFFVAAEHLQALDQGSLQLRYSVSNTSLATPLMSPRLWVQIGLQPEELPVPRVEGMDQEGDLRVTAGELATVTIGEHADIRPGDPITLNWVGGNAQGSLRQVGDQRVFQIPAQVLAAGLERPSTVSYSATSQSDRRVRQSRGLNLTATAGQSMVLGAPQVMEAGSEDGGLDPAKIPAQGATVLYQAQTQGLRPGDLITLHVAGAMGYESPPLVHDPEQPLSFLIPARLITASLGGTLNIHYSVSRGGREKGTSESSRHAVRQCLSVQTDPLQLNGLSVKYPAWRTTGVDSIGNTAMRPATGGVPPYTYRSSKPSVASVDAQGKVTGNGNGNATITITDARQFSVNYEVGVSNVWDLNIRTEKAWRWTHAVNWMTGLKGRPATVEYIADLQRVYGAPLPVPRYLWNCVKINYDAGAFYHHSYAWSGYFCIANTPNTNVYGGMCVTQRNG
ncbi:Ig-like domain-containing protein [Pseudomonas sp.]|uniref:Ig-like domain-containing protein n=1 Tax=Pseudomonas sp. TaxID=306 RepID=UPI003D6E8EF5